MVGEQVAQELAQQRRGARAPVDEGDGVPDRVAPHRFRTPKFAPTQPRPALVCPCHYSTFDPARAGKVLFGPAGRALPQLPLMVDRRGVLRAAGNFSGPVGPSWWGVRMKGARS